MLKGREILSLPVVTLDDKKQLGEVKDIIYDPSQNRILGYIVENCGWLKDGKAFLHRDLLRREEACLVIRDESVIKNISSFPDLKEALDHCKDIRGWQIEYDDGRYIGVIQDLLIEETSGKITGYEISDGVIQDLLNGRTTVSNQKIQIQCDKLVALEELVLINNWKGE